MHTAPISPLQHLSEHLQHAIWTGTSLGLSPSLTMSSGHPLLDAHLPGQGWPTRCLIDVLQTHSCLGECRLVWPAAKRMVQQGASVILISPPHTPYLPAWHREGIPAERLIWIQAPDQAARLWATEQALHAKSLTLIMSWLPQARPEQIRRLQAAAKHHPGLFFSIRPLSARHESAATPLRIALELGRTADSMQLRILKRQGAPLDQVLQIPCWPTGLSHLISPHHHAALDRTDTGQPLELSLH